ncbi:MAG: hypothetical protein JJ863_05765 [Deltaproteobacteria bacterium]|nr:hypothetical protein [Deltaproteobacteria bacterium]
MRKVELRRGPEEEERDGTGGIDVEQRRPAKDRRRRIRCPKCGYQPVPSDRWFCECGHSWNTFDTRGRCPACQKQWLRTACLRCHQWSLHEDWYEPEEGPNSG